MTPRLDSATLRECAGECLWMEGATGASAQLRTRLRILLPLLVLGSRSSSSSATCVAGVEVEGVVSPLCSRASLGPDGLVVVFPLMPLFEGVGSLGPCVVSCTCCCLCRWASWPDAGPVSCAREALLLPRLLVLRGAPLLLSPLLPLTPFLGINSCSMPSAFPCSLCRHAPMGAMSMMVPGQSLVPEHEGGTAAVYVGM